jgi:hypothetical protein
MRAGFLHRFAVPLPGAARWAQLMEVRDCGDGCSGARLNLSPVTAADPDGQGPHHTANATPVRSSDAAHRRCWMFRS